MTDLTAPVIARMPDQPPGVDGDDPKDVPNARDAAKRLLRYVEACGDGLYDVERDRGELVPLYARDLYAVCRVIRDQEEAETPTGDSGGRPE